MPTITDIIEKVDDITSIVSTLTGVPCEDIKGTGRNAETVEARHITLYVAARLAGIKRDDIAFRFNVEPASVTNACGKIARRAASDTWLAAVLRDASEAIQQRSHG